MGDDKGGTSLHDMVHTLLNQPLRTCVDATGSLVKYEHRGVGNGSTGNSQQLALALTEVATITVKHGVITTGQTANEVIGTYKSGSLPTFLIGSIQPTVANVLQYSIGKEACLLKHDAHALAQRRLVNICNRNAVIEDAATLYLIETVNQVNNGGLTGTRSTHKGYLLSRRSVDINIEEHLLRWRISEVHIGEVYVALCMLKHHLPLVHLWLCIHQGKDALGTH